MMLQEQQVDDLTPDLVHCIYCSASANGAFTPRELEDILIVSRKNNQLNNVTGILLYFNGSILQVLEGNRLIVESLFNKISLDKRHAKISKLIFEEIERRDFAQWTMGFPKITTDELSRIPGLNDFFVKGNSYLELGEGRAKKLLSAFREGQWRIKI